MLTYLSRYLTIKSSLILKKKEIMPKKFKTRKLKTITVSLYEDQLNWLRSFGRLNGGYNKLLRFIIDNWSEFKQYLKEKHE